MSTAWHADHLNDVTKNPEMQHRNDAHSVSLDQLTAHESLERLDGITTLTENQSRLQP